MIYIKASNLQQLNYSDQQVTSSRDFGIFFKVSGEDWGNPNHLLSLFFLQEPTIDFAARIRLNIKDIQKLNELFQSDQDLLKTVPKNIYFSIVHPRFYCGIGNYFYSIWDLANIVNGNFTSVSLTKEIESPIGIVVPINSWKYFFFLSNLMDESNKNTDENNVYNGIRCGTIYSLVNAVFLLRCFFGIDNFTKKSTFINPKIAMVYRKILMLEFGTKLYHPIRIFTSWIELNFTELFKTLSNNFYTWKKIGLWEICCKLLNISILWERYQYLSTVHLHRNLFSICIRILTLYIYIQWKDGDFHLLITFMQAFSFKETKDHIINKIFNNV